MCEERCAEINEEATVAPCRFGQDGSETQRGGSSEMQKNDPGRPPEALQTPVKPQNHRETSVGQQGEDCQTLGDIRECLLALWAL